MVLFIWLGLALTPSPGPSPRIPMGRADEPAAVEVIRDGRIVFDVTLHKADDIVALLHRAERLSQRTAIGGDPAGVALVLHGPEIEFFARKNYSEYKDIVDLAARLDANRVIDVKVCQTKMRELHLESEDMPPFVEQVPYGPDEVERLRRQGYTYL